MCWSPVPLDGPGFNLHAVGVDCQAERAVVNMVAGLCGAAVWPCDGAGSGVDVTHPATLEEAAASAFWADVAGTVQRVGGELGVRHVVMLSIVGIEKTSFGYYRAKRAHERAMASGPVPVTVLRATQFHELPTRLIAMTRQDGHASVFDARVQPVAARTVAAVLFELAAGAPVGRAADLAEPQQAGLVELARAFVQRRGLPVEVQPEPMEGVPAGALLPEATARIDGPSFDEWLVGQDAAALRV